MNQPKVAIFLHTLALGGIAMRMATMTRLMLERGITVQFVIAQRQPDQRECPLPDEVQVYDLNCPKMSLCMPRLARYLREQQPDGLLSAPTHANVAAVLTGVLARGKTRLVLNEATPPLTEKTGLNVSLTNRAMYRLVPWAYRRADAVVAISQGVADQLVDGFGLPAQLIHVIPNPVVTPALLQQAQQPVSHPWLTADRPDRVLIGVGRLSQEKGFDTLLTALAQVRRVRGDVRLILVGDGPQRQQLEHQVQSLGLADVVSMVGFQDNAPAWIAKADLLVQPSRYEGFGNTLVEALACGKPVISTTCPGGPREILDEGRYGTLVAPDDAAALAQAVLQTLSAPPDTNMLQNRAMNYAAEPIVDRYIELLLGTNPAGLTSSDDAHGNRTDGQSENPKASA